MPVGDEEQAGILVLQLDPVGQHAVVVAEVEAPGGRMPERTFSAYMSETEKGSDQGVEEAQEGAQDGIQQPEKQQGQQDGKPQRSSCANFHAGAAAAG
jgi:hypothetical protein